MEPWVAFVIGVAVGMAVVVGAQRIRGGPASAVPGVGLPAATGSPVAPPGSTVLTSSSIRFEGGRVSIVVDGRPYQRLADVPEDDRELLVKELRAVAESNAAESVRGQIRDFLAGSDPGHEV